MLDSDGIEFTAPKSMYSRFEQPLNAFYPIEATPLGKYSLVKPVQPSNADSSIEGMFPYMFTS